MNLREEIFFEHSKKQCNRIVNWVDKSQQRFDELFKLFLSEEYRVVQRSAWPVSNCVLANPLFINKHWEELISSLHRPNLHVAVKRNTIRLLQNIFIPEKYHGQLMKICFDYLENPAEAVAVKCFSLTVLEKLSKKYPEILPELKLIITEQLENAAAGFKSRAFKILMKQ
jgi:hypothetical protein